MTLLLVKDALPDRVLHTLKDRSMTKRQVALEIGAKPESVGRAIEKLKNAGYLAMFGYRLAAPVYKRTKKPDPPYLSTETRAELCKPKKYRDILRCCETCRYWSDQVAKMEGTEILALCLADTGHDWTAAMHCCDSFALASLGAIDEPGSDPGRYAEL